MLAYIGCGFLFKKIIQICVAILQIFRTHLGCVRLCTRPAVEPKNLRLARNFELFTIYKLSFSTIKEPTLVAYDLVRSRR